jgi:hypothetical protein
MEQVPVHELILLGSLLRKPGSGYRFLGNASCALGMAEAALGLKRKIIVVGGGHEESKQLEQRYPWLTDTAPDYPCNCRKITNVTWAKRNVADVIIHLNDVHVCSNYAPRKAGWDLPKLAAWVKSVDPTLQSDKKIDKPVVEELNLVQV